MDLKENEKIYSWIIGGCTMLGIGVGFFLFFVFSFGVFTFVGSIMLGIGIGLITTAILRLVQTRDEQP